MSHLSVERIQNAPDHVARLVTCLQQLQPKLIDVASSGGYAHTLISACRNADASPMRESGWAMEKYLSNRGNLRF